MIEGDCPVCGASQSVGLTRSVVAWLWTLMFWKRRLVCDNCGEKFNVPRGFILLSLLWDRIVH